jgi:hypothetical protein
MTRVADLMTDKLVSTTEWQDKPTETIQVDHMNTMIQSNMARIEEITKWFDDNPIHYTIKTTDVFTWKLLVVSNNETISRSIDITCI